MRQRVMLQANVGVEHRALGFSCPIHSKEIGKTEVPAPYTPLIVKTRLMRSDEVSPILDKGPELVALHIAECSHVRQYQRRKWGKVRGVEQAVMHHLEGDARFDQSLIPAESIVFNLRFGMPIAVVPGRLLGVNQSDSCERPLMREVLLILFRPKIDFFNTLQPTLIMESAGEFAAPRTHTIGNSVHNPDANFGVAGDAVLPAIRFLQTDTEKTDNGFVAHCGAILLCRLTDKPGRGKTMTSLAVGREHRRAAA